MAIVFTVEGRVVWERILERYIERSPRLKVVVGNMGVAVESAVVDSTGAITRPVSIKRAPGGLYLIVEENPEFEAASTPGRALVLIVLDAFSVEKEVIVSWTDGRFLTEPCESRGRSLENRFSCGLCGFPLGQGGKHPDEGEMRVGWKEFPPEDTVLLAQGRVIVDGMVQETALLRMEEGATVRYELRTGGVKGPILLETFVLWSGKGLPQVGTFQEVYDPMREMDNAQYI